MQVTENSTEGLKHAYTIKVEAGVLDSKLNEKLKQLAGQIRLPGFRPGKVPMSYLQKLHGDQLLGEVLEETVSTTSREMLEERDIRPALQPDIEIKEFEKGGDLEYDMSVEVLPEIEPADFSTIELEREVAAVEDEQIDEALQRIADQQKTYEAPEDAGYKAADGDLVIIDFVGKKGDEPFEGGAAEDYRLELGSGNFIPGFEDQLIGVAKGDEKEVKVTFPEDYGSEDLAGQEAVFEVTVKEVQQPVEAAIDDELAKKVGLDDLEALRNTLKESIQREHDQVGRLKLKRSLLDVLADKHDFVLPEGLVDMEFNQLWDEQTRSLEAEGKDLESADKSEEEMRTEARDMAVRRVRLGLLLRHIGESNDISVSAEELQRKMMEEAQRFPGQEREVLQFYQQNPQMMEQIRAPLLEDKVVDFIIEMAKVTDKEVPRDELFKDPDEEDESAD
ncbi:MAG: trigger factor [Alphaproteobacteria bacterium]